MISFKFRKKIPTFARFAVFGFLLIVHYNIGIDGRYVAGIGNFKLLGSQFLDL